VNDRCGGFFASQRIQNMVGEVAVFCGNSDG